jgi:lipopolysaccharide/colanic/teichoic acid biosynthesis glycosyltransferase
MHELPNAVKQHISARIDIESYQVFNSLSSQEASVEKKQAQLIFHNQMMNNMRFIHPFFESVNERLAVGDLFVGSFETFASRRSRKKLYQVPYINKIVLFYEFLFLRVVPKIKGLRSIYFFFSKGKDQLLSKAEVLGRLVCCGFLIEDYFIIHGTSWFIAKKIKSPTYKHKSNYGPLIQMNRIGIHGKIIRVYKFRTMHPYSEYLQDYVLKHNGYAHTGKPANDFRLTPWGKFMRKYWLDELPQIYNILKGQMKLVGVRPVSQRYFQDIPPELKALRLKHKPGCIPPYVALNRNADVESVQNAEFEYLIQKNKHPYTTDMRYFFRALFNILVRRKRSA